MNMTFSLTRKLFRSKVLLTSIVLTSASFFMSSTANAVPETVDLNTTEKSAPHTGFNAGQFFLGIFSASLDLASSIPAISSTKAILDNFKYLSSGAKVALGTIQTVDQGVNQASAAYNASRIQFNQYLEDRNTSAIETIQRQWPTLMLDYANENNLATIPTEKIRDYVGKFAGLERELSEIDGESVVFQFNAATIKASLLYTVYLRTNNHHLKQQHFNDYIVGLEVSDAYLKAKETAMVKRLQEAYTEKTECTKWNSSDACLRYRGFIENNQTKIKEKLPESTWAREWSTDALKDADKLKNTRIARIVNDYKAAYQVDAMLNSIQKLRQEAVRQHNLNNIAYVLQKVKKDIRGFDRGYEIDLGEERLINGVVINQKLGSTWLNFPAITVAYAKNDYRFEESNTFKFPVNWASSFFYANFRNPAGKAVNARYIRVYAGLKTQQAFENAEKLSDFNSMINVLGADEAASSVVALAKWSGDLTWSKPSPKAIDNVYWNMKNSNSAIEEWNKIDTLGQIRDRIEFSPFSIAANSQEICRIRLHGIMPPQQGIKFNLTFSFYTEFGTELTSLKRSLSYTLRNAAATIDFLVPRTSNAIHKVRVSSSASPLRIAEIDVYPVWSDPACNGQKRLLSDSEGQADVIEGDVVLDDSVLPPGVIEQPSNQPPVKQIGAVKNTVAQADPQDRYAHLNRADRRKAIRAHRKGVYIEEYERDVVKRVAAPAPAPAPAVDPYEGLNRSDRRKAVRADKRAGADAVREREAAKEAQEKKAQEEAAKKAQEKKAQEEAAKKAQEKKRR